MSSLKHEVTADRWRALIRERMDSGMTIKDWCRERNIKEPQYYYWLKILRHKEADAAEHSIETTPFVELPLVCQEQECRPDRPAAVIRKGDISIEITESASAGFLARIMEAAAHAW